MAGTAFIVARGVSGGIERTASVMMPALFVIVIGLALYVTTLDGARFARAATATEHIRARIAEFLAGRVIVAGRTPDQHATEKEGAATDKESPHARHTSTRDAASRQHRACRNRESLAQQSSLIQQGLDTRTIATETPSSTFQLSSVGRAGGC